MDNCEIELAWAAGFFDGEGSCTSTVEKYRGLTRYRRLTIGQKNREPLERFKRAVGNIGSIYEAKDGMYHWTASCNNAIKVYDLIKPYLCSIKIKQWDTALIRERIPDRIAYARV